MDQDLVTISCPACRKENQCEAGSVESACTRCSCDLTHLTRIRWIAKGLRRHALGCLQSGDWQEAFVAASDSWELEHHPTSAHCALLASAVLGEWEDWAVWRARGAAQGVSK